MNICILQNSQIQYLEFGKLYKLRAQCVLLHSIS